MKIQHTASHQPTQQSVPTGAIVCACYGVTTASETAEVCTTGRIHTWWCKRSQKLMAGDTKDHRGESTATLLNGCIVFSLFMFTPINMCSQPWSGNLFVVGSNAEKLITVQSAENSWLRACSKNCTCISLPLGKTVGKAMQSWGGTLGRAVSQASQHPSKGTRGSQAPPLAEEQLAVDRDWEESYLFGSVATDWTWMSLYQPAVTGLSGLFFLLHRRRGHGVGRRHAGMV